MRARVLGCASREKNKNLERENKNVEEINKLKRLENGSDQTVRVVKVTWLRGQMLAPLLEKFLDISYNCTVLGFGAFSIT